MTGFCSPKTFQAFMELSLDELIIQLGFELNSIKCSTVCLTVYSIGFLVGCQQREG